MFQRNPTAQREVVCFIRSWMTRVRGRLDGRPSDERKVNRLRNVAARGIKSKLVLWRMVGVMTKYLEHLLALADVIFYLYETSIQNCDIY